MGPAAAVLMTPSAAAAALHDARLRRRPVPMLTSRHEGADAEWAYAVQAAGLRLRQADGEQVVGGKLGFTSRAMQQAMDVHHPNYGWLTDAMLVHDGRVALDGLIHPKAEPEVAFLLGDDLARTASAVDVIAATAAVLPCIEVVDSRYEDFRFGPLDNIADNSSAGRVVLGPPMSPAGLHLALVGCVLYADGELIATAAGAAALDHPAAAVAWMARAAEEPLRAGHVVISGGLTPPLDLVPGATVTAVFDHLGVAELSVY